MVNSHVVPQVNEMNVKINEVVLIKQMLLEYFYLATLFSCYEGKLFICPFKYVIFPHIFK